MEQLTVGTKLRLDEIVKHLRIGKAWLSDPKQKQEIINACLSKVEYLLNKINPKGEIFADKISKQFQVKFEEIRDHNDLKQLEEYYIKTHKELGFICLRDEIESENIDAWLFQRINASQEDLDRWVAVLNLTRTESRAYWNKFHELSHRLAEPPQKLLPFKREEVMKTDPVEKLVDCIAGELAFHPMIFNRYIEPIKRKHLDFTDIEQVRKSYAPSASLLATTNAVVKRMDRPAISFTASLKNKKDGSGYSLRVIPQSSNELAQKEGLRVFPNMRVPTKSSVYKSFSSKTSETAQEMLNEWSTSNGDTLIAAKAIISSISLGDNVYGIITM